MLTSSKLFAKLAAVQLIGQKACDVWQGLLASDPEAAVLFLSCCSVPEALSACHVFGGCLLLQKPSLSLQQGLKASLLMGQAPL